VKIDRIHIENYRGIENIDMEFDDYTAIIGPNGAGKSSILYALNWFFHDTPLDEFDVYREKDDFVASGYITVTVVFAGITPADRVRLGMYGRGENASFTRKWTPGEKSKLYGNAMAGPGFAEVRAASKIGEKRTAYSELRDQYSDLAEIERLASKEEIESNLAAWEDDPRHRDLLINLPAVDAPHMQGIAGSGTLRECTRIVLVPASTDIDLQIGEPRKGNALSELVGHLVADAGATAVSAWSAKHEKLLDELAESVRSKVEQSTKIHSTRVNSILQSLVPKAEVVLDPVIPSAVPRSIPSVNMKVSVDGLSTDITRHGHGVQRAVMVSVMQSLVPDRSQVEYEHSPLGDESPDDSKDRLQQTISSLPTLIVCIEEPEVFQHPIRARAFARTLTEAASTSTVQVIIATHSPYFVRPEQFASLRRMSVERGKASVIKRTADDVRIRAGLAADQLERVIRFLQRNIPASFSEGFFADRVILVEGDTDRLIIEVLAEHLGYSLDLLGVSIIDMGGKGNLHIATALFAELGVPAYIVVDSDALGHERIMDAKGEKTLEQRRAESRSKHEKDTNAVLAWMQKIYDDPGITTYSFGDPTTASPLITVWEDAIEHELAQWPSFATALSNVGGELKQKNIGHLRSAAIDASTDDLPDSIRECMSAIADFAKAPSAEEVSTETQFSLSAEVDSEA